MSIPVLNIQALFTQQGGLDWNVYLSVKRCQTLASMSLGTTDFPNSTQQLSDAQTSRDLQAVIRRCVQTPQGRNKEHSLPSPSTDAPGNGSRW